MPELPEVEALSLFIKSQSAGQTVERIELGALSALKSFDPPLEALAGRKVSTTGRWGKYLGLGTADSQGQLLWLVTHLSLGGWIQWREKLSDTRIRPGKGPLALRIGLSSGSGMDITEQGTEKRLALWVVSDPLSIPQIASLGPDPLAPGFDLSAFRKALGGAKGNLKTQLVDQRVIAGIGNAYSDEALHVARLSPFKTVAKLSEEESARLFEAIIEVLSDATTRSADVPAKGLKAEKKSGMRVHGRTGEACPVCGDVVREVSFSSRSLQYCATCQTGGKPLADRRMSRLLK